MVKIGLLKPKNSRVITLLPQTVKELSKDAEIFVEKDAGKSVFVENDAFEREGAKVVSRDEVLKNAQVFLFYRLDEDTARELPEGSTVVGFIDPFNKKDLLNLLKDRKINAIAFELVPRISRAQYMDALTSTAMLAGYYSVILAARYYPRRFPYFMTAAGTLFPANVFVIGAGVAGLQAIANAKRLGAVVYGYDIRPQVKQEIESLGAKFVELPLTAEEKEGYAVVKGEELIKRQRELLKDVLPQMDVVITTAAVLGGKAPLIITKDLVEIMKPGSVIVDLAAPRGGNVELTRLGEVVEHNDVKIVGMTDASEDLFLDASFMLSNNTKNLLKLFLKDGELVFDMEDEIVRKSLATYNGEIYSEFLKEVKQ